MKSWRHQWRNSWGDGGGAERPDPSYREISADLPGKETQGKKENGEEEEENLKREGGKWKGRGNLQNV